jgi:hypothetical protein
MLYLISTQTLASATSTISFTSIPTTFDHLMITGTFRGDNAGTGAPIAVSTIQQIYTLLTATQATVLLI